MVGDGPGNDSGWLSSGGRALNYTYAMDELGSVLHEAKWQSDRPHAAGENGMTLQTNIRTDRYLLRWVTVGALAAAGVLAAFLPVGLAASPPTPQSSSATKQTPAESSQTKDDSEGKKAESDERGLDDAWETFRPKGMEASFEMPKKPKLRERSFAPVANEPAIKVHLHSAVVQNGEIMFVAGWHDLHTIPRNALQQQDVLDGAVSTAVANVLGSITEKKKIRLERYPGREINYRFSAGDVLYRVIERVYLVGARQYQFRMLAQIDRFDRASAERFFDSVRLLDPDNDLPPRPRKRKRR